MTCNTTPPDPNNEDPQDQGSRPKAGSSPNTATRLVSLVLRADAELLHDQRQTLNVGDDGNWRMILAWLLGTLRASGPYAVLVLHGEQGSAKSTTAEGLRHLVDPKTPLLRAAPGSEQDLAIAAQNGWVTAYDNLS